ncbi:MAG: membrane protein insertase YidC [Hyphomicrobiales bacterium]
MQDNKNFIIAIVLSMMVLLGWQVFVVGPQEEQRRILAEEQQALEQQAAANGTAQTPSVPAAPGSNTSATNAQVPASGVVPAAPGSAVTPAAGGDAALTLEAALKSDKRIAIETKSLSGSINLVGGRIDDLLLKDYNEENVDDSPLVRLFHPVGSENAYYAETGLVAAAGGPVLPNSETVWNVSGNKELGVGKPVVLTWDNGAGLTFERTYDLDENYMFTLTDKVKNSGSELATLYPYGFVSRRGEPSTTGIWILHEGLIGFFGKDIGLEEIDYDDLEDDNNVQEVEKTSSGWLGITDKYWAATLIPPQQTPFKGRFAHKPGTLPSYQADFLSDPITVAAGGEASATTRLFAGAKQTTLIDEYQEKLEVENFELMIDWGWFYFLTKPLFYLLHWLFGVFGNFGVAILGVTVIVKILFFWFANRSYVSMSKMKLLQPKMKEIQERNKDDKQRQQQEVMKLYKEEKVNPLAGCWPVLIQIPVFFSLYKVLFVTIEMRHAPFFGWIQDLAAPDPTTIFNLFGILPFSLPEWMPLIGIWPIIMGITMFVQMKLNPSPPDPTQQMIFNWMPVVFTVMLATFPAGLVIYWAWNNFLSVMQQYVIMTRQGVKVDILGNVLDTFRKNKKSKQLEKTD